MKWTRFSLLQGRHRTNSDLVRAGGPVHGVSDRRDRGRGIIGMKPAVPDLVLDSTGCMSAGLIQWITIAYHKRT